MCKVQRNKQKTILIASDLIVNRIRMENRSNHIKTSMEIRNGTNEILEQVNADSEKVAENLLHGNRLVFVTATNRFANSILIVNNYAGF